MVFARGARFFGFSSFEAMLLQEAGREVVGELAGSSWSVVMRGLDVSSWSAGVVSQTAGCFRSTELSIERGICEKKEPPWFAGEGER